MNSLFVAWRPPLPDSTGWRPVGRLEHEGGIYRFSYTRGARKPGFRPFPQMDRLDQIYESAELFPVFANRLLSESRPEYEQFLRWSGLEAESQPDPIVILSVTEGIRQTDAIEVFPCPVPNADACYLSKFFLHGIRWMSLYAIDRISRLRVGERLRLMLDFQNEIDPFAVAVRTDQDRTQIGYVPRYFASDISQIASSCTSDNIQLSVARVNRDAPLQNRVLCRLHACWPDGFKPCSGDDFEPIPAGVPARCHV